MKKQSEISAFWQAYLSSLPKGVESHPTSFEFWHFCDNEEDANELAELVKNGIKTATCSLVWAYEAEKVELPVVGDHSIITNWDEKPVCIIETIEVQVRPFNEVDDKFAYDEGEGDRSLAYWRSAHWTAFSRECAVIGRVPVETMPLLCERFRVVFVNQAAPNIITYVTGSGLNRPDGFALDDEGNLYVANWGGGSGQTVLKIAGPQEVTNLDFVFDAPDALVFDNTGNLYVSNYNSGVISRITPEGVISDFATGLQNPSALAFDRDGNLFVSNFGGKKVSKITSDGVVSTFATGFDAPLGLVFDSQGNLFVSDYAMGSVIKILPDGSSSTFATVPNPATSKIQYLALSESGNLYVPSYGHNQIYRITAEGIVTVFAGSGAAGTNDGPLDLAEFNGPNSIAISSDGILYLSEYNSNCIRVIRGADL